MTSYSSFPQSLCLFVEHDSRSNAVLQGLTMLIRLSNPLSLELSGAARAPESTADKCNAPSAPAPSSPAPAPPPPDSKGKAAPDLAHQYAVTKKSVHVHVYVHACTPPAYCGWDAADLAMLGKSNSCSVSSCTCGVKMVISAFHAVSQ